MTGATQVVIDEENPWPGLGAFHEEAERFFNGRNTETAELHRLVSYAPLTVLFGASGLGKTSLVQAGLSPIVRREHFLPVYVRLDVRDRNAPLIDQAKIALQMELEARRIDAPPSNGESLWRYLHRRGLEFWSERNHLLTPIFVFDQFEEVFTLGAENPSAVAQLRIDLADLIENRMPASLADNNPEHEASAAALSPDNQRYKVVLSFREEYLAQVENWKRDLPSLLRNRFRLLPMSGQQAFEAVYTTAAHLVDQALARRIVVLVAAAQDHSTSTAPTAEGDLSNLEVEPAMLSLVCHGLNERRKRQKKTRFDDALLSGGTGQSIVAEYYHKAVGDLPQVRRFIEEQLITERGFRKPCDLDDAQRVHGVRKEELDLLVERRVIRIEPWRGTERVELIHDLLTSVVREERDRRRSTKRWLFRGALFVGALFVAAFITYILASRILYDTMIKAQTAAARTVQAVGRSGVPTLAASCQEHANKQKVHVYLQIRSEEQRPKAKRVADELTQQCFPVLGIELLQDIGPNSTELRYFLPSDEELAEHAGQIVNRALSSGQQVDVKYVRGYEQSAKIRGQLELWLAPM